ncbi:uncharacterized protein LOC121356509 [Pyrgilauda ruficollis]|uniref:uncharacterized protein LOC121356509 n=1 Tax=Pyrgilauda ruficollis TaxID=221976 RepID=UPI001B86A5BE|nr:uncharacterized protein LOC121356509 [Pyrgilauda ruficollis]
MEPQEVPPRQLLERQVAVVATLGEVVAAVTGRHRDARQRVSPVFLRAALGSFTRNLCEILDHGDVTSLRYFGVPSLGRALAAFEATPEACDNAIAAVVAWRKMVDALQGRWGQLACEAAELCAATTQARDPQDKAARRGTDRDKLVAAGRWPTVDWDWEEEEEVASVGGTRDAWEAAAASEEEVAINEEEVAMSEEELAANEEEAAINKEEVAIKEEELATNEEELATNKEEVATSQATGEAVVAASRARAAARRGHWAEAALEPLQRLVAACDSAIAFTRNMQFYLWEINVILKFGDQASRDVLEALEAKVAEFQQLWDASARLCREYLLGTLELIDKLLLSPYGGPGGPSGPGSRVVTERCREAIENIPRLLWGQ